MTEQQVKNPNNDNFYPVTVDVVDIDLDAQNPRISLRKGADDKRCIERLAHNEGDQLLALCKDIADNGLGIDHIVVKKDSDGSWVVRDGNRRVAALKMLNNPAEAPHELRQKVTNIADNANTYIPVKITCQTSDSESQIALYIKRKHLGAGKGEGQRDWEAVERAMYELSIGEKGQDDLSAKLLRYLSENELAAIPPKFPITTLTRYLNSDRLEEIGFSDINQNPPILNVGQDTVNQRVLKLFNDINDGVVTVSRPGADSGGMHSFYTTEGQSEYHQGIMKLGVSRDSSSSADDNVVKDQSADVNTDSSDPKDLSDDSSDETERGKPDRGITKPDHDRNYVAKPIRQHGIPSLKGKAKNIQVELTRINAKNCPVAAAVLVRMFVELSVGNYVTVNNLEDKAVEKAKAKGAKTKPVSLSFKIQAAVDHLLDNRKLTRGDKDVIYAMTDVEQMSLQTLNQVVHSNHFFTDKQALMIFWDNLLPFLRRCWGC